MLDLRLKGLSYRKIAAQTGLSEWKVRNICIAKFPRRDGRPNVMSPIQSYQVALDWYENCTACTLVASRFECGVQTVYNALYAWRAYLDEGNADVFTP